MEIYQKGEFELNSSFRQLRKLFGIQENQVQQRQNTKFKLRALLCNRHLKFF